jgi:beta-galactosidase
MRMRGRALQSCVVLLVSGIVSALWAQYTPLSARNVNVKNKTWTFIKSDVAVATAAGTADPSGWSNVNLPHSFDIPYWRAAAAVAPYIGWYRKHFTIDQSIITAKKRVFVEFGAVFEASQTYVNGMLVGRHNGGYTGFSYDITGNVTSGDNVLAVRVDGSWCDTIAPRSGEHIFIGGIYRDVYLVITDPLHVPWYGTFVSTPQATASSGTVKVKTEIKNDGTASANCSVKSVVVDAAGTQVTSFTATQAVAAGATVTFVQTSGAIANPHLWSPSSPYMYKVYTEVYNGTTAVDNFESPLGFRTATWNATNGFVLNGQKFWLQGANVHQDHAGWGDAIAKTACFRDVKLVKDCGMNFIRGSHYPHNSAFADACDKYGICFWAESDFWGLFWDATGWKSGAYPTSSTAAANAFDTNALRQLREFIQINRNHPSVIVWSMGNEVWFTNNATRTNALIHTMMIMANTVDSTRMAGMGGVQSNGLDAMVGGWGGVAGENGSGGAVINPGYPTMVSEYGSCQQDRPGNLDGCWGAELTSQGAGTSAPPHDAWRGGVATWCAFHHGSNNGAGNMGMIDHARLPLRRWYFYRNLYLGTPNPTWPVSGTASKLKLTTDRDTLTDDGTTDCQLIVQVQNASGAWLSNTPNITLTDQSGLGSFPTGSSITFTGGALEEGVREGLAAIEFRSYNAGTVKIKATSGTLTPDSVTITVIHVPDNPVTAVRIPVVSQGAAGPQEVVVAGYGSRIVLPGSIAGKKVVVSLFDMRGRLIGQTSPDRARVIVRPGAAAGIVIAKVKVVK